MNSSISDIERLIRDSQAALDWAPVPLGSPLRSHAYSYRNWGIEITPENVEWLQAESRKAFAVEWEDTDSSMNALIADASERAGLADTNALLNAKIAKYAVDMLSSRRDRAADASVIDIGAGAGGTSLAFIRAILGLPEGWRPERVVLSLIEPSESRLRSAEGLIMDAAEGTWLHHALEIILKRGTVGTVAEVPPEFADIILSNAAIHHESFNDHLPLIRRALSDGAAFVSGDWHESTLEHPARIYWVYHVLQNPHNEANNREVMAFILGLGRPPPLAECAGLSQFRTLFGLEDRDVFDAYKNHTDSEMRAAVGSLRYWIELGKSFSGSGKKCPERMLQCHERVSKRLEALKNAGFVFDGECRAKYCEVIRDRGFGELGTVMTAKKAQAQIRNVTMK